MTPEPNASFEALLTYLVDDRGVDFTGYKRPSLMRLVNRRMTAVGISTYAAYVDLLQVEPGELPRLLDALLINVTAMFRDPAAWAELRDEVLPPVLARLDPEEPIRAWSAACASGEEAYTLAITLHELLGDEQFKKRVKVYATDIDEDALAQARAGRFTAETLAPLTDLQRETYFERGSDGLRFRSDLRPHLIFGRHDLLQDAPISQVVVLTCRNVLMYLTSDTQARVLDRYAFALHEQGVLMLGKAEMLLTQSQVFSPVSLPHRIFKARRVAGAARLASLAVGGSGRDVRMRRVTEAAFVNAPDPQVLLDGNGVLTLLNERAERDLRVTRDDLGRPFAELEISHRPVELRGVVAAVQASGEAVEVREVSYEGASDGTWWDIRVSALGEAEQVLGVQLVFTDITQSRQLKLRLEQLHRELTTAYEELQSSSEELETTNEELQSAVEELETTNEELQSTNEELETMNEELQSTNEELQTLNDELRERTLQVDESNGFLHGILEGLEVAVLVVDTDYRVQLWNGGAERLTGFRAFEAEGKLLIDLELDLPVHELHTALRRVMVQGDDEGSLTAPVTNRFGRALRRTARVSPVRPPQGDVRGAIVTLVDAPDHEVD